MAGDVGDHRVGAGGDHHRADRQAVETVGEIDRVGSADDHEHGERNIKHAKIEAKVLDERKRNLGAEPRLSK